MSSTATIQIRPVGETDRPLLARWISDPRYLANIRSVSTADGLEELLERLISSPEEHEALFLERNGVPCVLMELMWINYTDGTIEVDLLFDPTRPAKGLSTAAYIRAIARYLFLQRKFRKIYSFIYEDNVRSLRIFGKLFDIEATVPYPKGNSVVQAYVLGADRTNMLRVYPAKSNLENL